MSHLTDKHQSRRKQCRCSLGEQHLKLQALRHACGSMSQMERESSSRGRYECSLYPQNILFTVLYIVGVAIGHRNINATHLKQPTSHSMRMADDSKRSIVTRLHPGKVQALLWLQQVVQRKRCCLRSCTLSANVLSSASQRAAGFLRLLRLTLQTHPGAYPAVVFLTCFRGAACACMHVQRVCVWCCLLRHPSRRGTHMSRCHMPCIVDMRIGI
jgi:hypothetical protein